MNNIDDRIIDQHDKMTILQLGMKAQVKKKKRNRSSQNRSVISGGTGKIKMKKTRTTVLPHN
jgi:hypothetical protein